MTGLPRCQPASDYAYRFQYADGSAFVIYPDGTAFIEFKDGRREQKHGVIDNRIPLLIGMAARPRQDRIEYLEATEANKIAIQRAALDRIEKIAFDIPAPNPYTPQIVQLCIAARNSAHASAVVPLEQSGSGK